MTALPLFDSSRRSWAGVSSETRAAVRRDLLVDAAFNLLGTEGWAAVTVRGVCRAARLHPRYFYQAFGDIDDLLVAVFDRLIDELQQTIVAAIEEAPPGPATKARAGLTAVAMFVSEDRRRARVLYTEALGNDRLNRRRIETIQQFVGLLVPAKDDPAAEVGAHIAVGGFTSALVAWLDGRLAVSFDELIDDSTAVLMAARRATARGRR